MKEGDPVVAGIYRFRGETGLWPEYLDDLVPRYLEKAAGVRWYYTLTREGPSLATTVGDRYTHVGYLFDAERPEWRVFGNEETRTLRWDAGAAATHPAMGSDE